MVWHPLDSAGSGRGRTFTVAVALLILPAQATADLITDCGGRTACLQPPPPYPVPPEPSPPPPPVPLAPEPAPPDGNQDLFFYFDGQERIPTMRPIEGPGIMVHMLISTLSAVGMLMLACSLRVQHRVRLRPPVALAQVVPVLQVYGIVPGEETTAPIGEGEGEGDGSGNAIENVPLPPIAPVVEGGAEAMIEVELQIVRGVEPTSRVTALPLTAGAPITIGQPVNTT